MHQPRTTEGTSLHGFKLNRNRPLIPGTHSRHGQSTGHGWQQPWEQEQGRRWLWEAAWPGWIVVPRQGRYRCPHKEISRGSEAHVLRGRAIQGVLTAHGGRSVRPRVGKTPTHLLAQDARGPAMAPGGPQSPLLLGGSLFPPRGQEAPAQPQRCPSTPHPGLHPS